MGIAIGSAYQIFKGVPNTPTEHLWMLWMHLGVVSPVAHVTYTVKPKQDGPSLCSRNYEEFLTENVRISMQVSLKSIHECPENSSPQEQNGLHLADEIPKRIFLNENISLV